MSAYVFLSVVRGVINVNKFEVRLLPSSHLYLQNNTYNRLLQQFCSTLQNNVKKISIA